MYAIIKSNLPDIKKAIGFGYPNHTDYLIGQKIWIVDYRFEIIDNQLFYKYDKHIYIPINAIQFD